MGFKLKDIVKVAAPIAAGAFLGPMAGTALQGMGLSSAAASPFIRSALASGIGSLAFGQKPKDALRSALLGGIGGQFMSGMSAPAAQTGMQTYGTAGGMGEQARFAASTPSATPPSSGVASAFRGAAPGAEAKTMSGELLKSVGFAGEDKGNLLFRLMNTQMGEGLAAGLLATLLAGDEEEEDSRGSFERRPYGQGGPGGQLGGITYAADGGYFPRRNGGIDPSEGSGKKDDVPAMLMAGEFVMTRDAVKGAGNGNLREGIDKMYNMMNKFERMA
jgi:hypothetical protein